MCSELPSFKQLRMLKWVLVLQRNYFPLISHPLIQFPEIPSILKAENVPDLSAETTNGANALNNL